MRIVVSIASKHGSTAELGDALSQHLADRGAEVVRTDPDELDTLAGADAVVLGSGVYAGRWLEAAIHAVDRLETELKALPVWLLSSGPLGDPPGPAEEPAGVAPIAERLGAIDHRVLAGRLRREDLSLPERAVVKVVRAPYGDFRDWPAVEAFAEDIVTVVRGQVPST